MWSVAPDNLSGFKKCSYGKTNEITNIVVILTPSTFIISCELWRCSIVTELKDFDSCWSVSHLSLVTCWHLFVILGYIIRWGFWILFVLQGSRYIEVLFYTFYWNFGRAEDYRSLYRRIRYIEVRYIVVPLRFKLHQASETSGILFGSSGSY